MKTFKYVARSTHGGTTQGMVEANTRAEAVSSLNDSGMIVESISEVNRILDMDLRLGNGRTKEKSLAVMCNQFSIILRAGLPIFRALYLVSDQTEDKTLKQILKDVADDVSAGYSLADSFEKYGKGLPASFVESVRAGEASGSLEAVFKRLSDYYEKSSRTKAKVKSAMVYPTFVIITAVVVVAIIMIFAVPVFTETFLAMGTELPAMTRLVIAASDFMTHYFLLLVVIAVALVLAVKMAKKNEAFYLRWSELGVKIPVIGRITRMNAAAQYAGTMGVMMRAGLSVAHAVEITARSMSNHYMAESLANTVPALESGLQLATCLEREGTMPKMVIEMTGVGEQTGSLEQTLEVMTDYYNNEVDVASSRALSILEPIIIVVLAVLVVILLLSVYMPMFTMYGGISSVA